MSNDKIDAPVEEENNNQPSPPKNKVSTFVKQYSKELLIAGGGLVVVIIIAVFIYFTFFSKSSMEDFAEDFCNCASEADGPTYYAYSKDQFGYRSELKGCFEEDFRLYGQNFNKAEKKELLIEFQKEVVKKCPKKLANVFEYK